MSGGSQHNPNGRQSHLGSGWSPLQLQVANLLARAPQAHMASDRGVTWHTPTPPPHLYHVPAPSPPDPLQALKSAGGNSVFRHTATPPELYRHTPTPPDKHHLRHTPSPGDIKANAALPPVDLYQHLGPSREKLRADDLMAYTRVGVDLSLGGGRAANGAATSPAPPAHAPPPAPSLSVRDAPTINSLIARAQPRHPHARVDALLERLVPSPVSPSPHSVIVHSRAAPTPSPPSSNEDSADSCGAPPGSKRKRKPERTVRVATAPLPPVPPAPAPAHQPPAPAEPPAAPRVSPPPNSTPAPAPPRENGDTPHVKADALDERPASPAPPARPDQPHARRKTRSGSAETIDDIAAMIADTDCAPPPPLAPPPTSATAVTVDKLRSVLASPDAVRAEPPPDVEPAVAPAEPPGEPAAPNASPAPPPAPAAAPRRRSLRTSNPEAPNVPVESPSEGKPAEPEASEASTAEPAAASFVEVENQLEKMFAGLEEPATSPVPAPDAAAASADEASAPAAARKRRRSAPARSDRARAHAAARKKTDARRPRKGPREPRDAYDSGSNASSSKSRGPYIQIRGPRDSPLSVSVMNTSTAEEEDCARRKGGKLGKGGDEFRNGVRGVRGLHASTRGLHASTRGLHASTLGLRYDATTPDATWLCAFCQRGPHAASLGDLFGPYTLETDCDEYRSLDEATRRRYCSGQGGGADEVWFHAACGVWAPGLLACGARVWGLAAAVWGARAARCGTCAAPGAALACAARGCRARVHLPCASAWQLREDEFRATCPHHA